jgi:hypothetical protein
MVKSVHLPLYLLERNPVPILKKAGRNPGYHSQYR